jgi:hypothetical protein
MRTKVLLCAATVAAGALTSMAQNVYSLNVVGYINLNLAPGLSLVANQLDADGTLTNNYVTNIFGATLPAGSAIYAFNGSTYLSGKFLASGKWNGGASSLTPYLAPGSGVFVQNAGASAVTVTLVGQVIQGTNTVAIAPNGGLTVVSSIAPISGGFQSVLGYTPTVGDTVIPWVAGTTQNYGSAHKYLASGKWSGGGEYVPAVGEAVFLSTAPANNNTGWTQIFTVQ